MNHYVYVKIRDGVAFDSIHPDLHSATKRIISLRREGRQAKAFTEEELRMYQQQVQQQPESTQSYQPIQQPIQQQPRQPRRGMF